MKKDGFFASLVRGVVEEEKTKYADRPPQMFMNEKKQMWYFLMNQIDSQNPPEQTEDPEEDDEDDEPEEADSPAEQKNKKLTAPAGAFDR